MATRGPLAAVRLGSVVAAIGLLLHPSPAQAHPFGPPQTVTISVDDDSELIRVHWRPGAPDDYSYLAAGIGVSSADLTQQGGGLLAVKRDADRLTSSPRFGEYLAEHVAVHDELGRPCAGTVLPVEHLVADGVDLQFRCDRPTDGADIDVSLLTDLHPAYQTMATGPGGQRFAYSVDHTAHHWSFLVADAPASLGRSAAVQLPLVLAGLVAAGAISTVVVRRTRRRTTS